MSNGIQDLEDLKKEVQEKYFVPTKGLFSDTTPGGLNRALEKLGGLLSDAIYQRIELGVKTARAEESARKAKIAATDKVYRLNRPLAREDKWNVDEKKAKVEENYATEVEDREITKKQEDILDRAIKWLEKAYALLTDIGKNSGLMAKIKDRQR